MLLRCRSTTLRLQLDLTFGASGLEAAVPALQLANEGASEREMKESAREIEGRMASATPYILLVCSSARPRERQWGPHAQLQRQPGRD